MAFSLFESSRSKGSPIDLYLFRYGPKPGDVYAFTNASRQITLNGIDYLPTPINRSKIVATGSLDQQVTEVLVDHNNPVANLYRATAPSYPVGLIIYQGHEGDNDFLPLWNGRVLGVNFDGYEATLGCEPVSTQRLRPGLRRHYQYGCPHVLYGTGEGKCNANKSAATFAATVSSVSGAKVTLPINWVSPALADRFLNGMIEWTNDDGNTETRTILTIDQDRILTLDDFVVDLDSGDSVNVIYGCSHDLDGCAAHQNLINFGGCPWIPTKNPIGQLNNFY